MTVRSEASAAPPAAAAPWQGARGLRGRTRGQLLLVASDRVSAFDVVMDEAVPYKGAVLTQLRAFWFRQLDTVRAIALHHGQHGRNHRAPARRWRSHRDQLAGRAMLVRRTDPVPFECVVRGYLAGSAWAEYQAHGHPGGRAAAQGMVESARLEPPLFSPATKAENGPRRERHLRDRRQRARRRRGAPRCATPASPSTRPGATTPPRRGIIIADTKFEFGHDARRHAAAHRRGADARFLALLARGPLRAGRHPAELRQAAAARLSRGAPAGRQAGTARRRRRRCPPRSSTRPARATSRRTGCLTGTRSWGTADARRPRGMAVHHRCLRHPGLRCSSSPTGGRCSGCPSRSGWWRSSATRRATASAGADLVIAPADGLGGRASARSTSPHSLAARRTRVSIFMNVFDVHVNRYPVGGTMAYRHYNPGQVPQRRRREGEPGERAVLRRARHRAGSHSGAPDRRAHRAPHHHRPRRSARRCSRASGWA